MVKKNILVTGIGGNVGQGIIRNIRSTKFNVNIIGCNTTSFSAGNHLCDVFYDVPFAYDADYIANIKKIVAEQKIDLIIPSTDFEVYYLSLHKEEIPTTIAVSSNDACNIYLDKYQTFLHHSNNNIPFAMSCLPSEYNNNYNETILKPKKGRGSRGIHINPENIHKFSDDEYLVQELIKGKEITTAFYITKTNNLHGSITMLRTLENGSTNQCEVTTKYDNSINKIISQMIKKTEFYGSVNIQSIVTLEGDIVPFEINCRISGTNSIRSQFGFEDVKYTLEEYLYNQDPSIAIINEGIAIRILMDVVYPFTKNSTDCLTNKSNFHIF